MIERDAFVEIDSACQEGRSDQRSQSEWREDACCRDRGGGADTMLDEIDVEIQANQKHVQNQAYLRRGVQHDVCWTRWK